MQKNLVPHYTRQIAHLRIARMRILSRPPREICYIELEEVSAALHDYKQKLRELKAEQEQLLDTYPEPNFDDSKIYDL